MRSPLPLDCAYHFRTVKAHSLQAFTKYFMQQGIPEITDAASQTNNLGLPSTSSQDGFQHRNRSSPDGNALERTRSSSPKSVAAGSDASGDGISARQLDEQLRRLSTNSHRSGGRPKASLPGQRISEYEKALTPSTPRQALGFKVIRRPDSPSDGVQLTDFPNGPYPSLLMNKFLD